MINRLFIFVVLLLLLNSNSAFAQIECNIGERIYFELPFKSEIKYSNSGKRAPREFLDTDAVVSVCQEDKNSDLHDKVSSFIDQSMADNAKEVEMLSVAESVNLNRLFYIGDELFAFVDLTTPSGQLVPFPIRLVQNDNEFTFSQLSNNQNLVTTLKYAVGQNKLITNNTNSTSISLSGTELNSVLLHANILFPDSNLPIFERIEMINSLINDEDYSSYFGLLDSRSLEKSKQFLDQKEADTKQDFARQAFSLPYVNYIIDANPIYFVAYDMAPNRIANNKDFQKPSGLRFQTFSSQNGDAVPWNLYYENGLTDLLISNGVASQIEAIKTKP